MNAPQPLAALRVIELTHMVMGPTCGMVLADLGAEVIKVEPIEGEATRRLLGAGAGFFPMFNRRGTSPLARPRPCRHHRATRRRAVRDDRRSRLEAMSQPAPSVPAEVRVGGGCCASAALSSAAQRGRSGTPRRRRRV